ncbi:hypothetical protein ACGC1H_007486 [Rhizoctonia solani]
MGSAVSYSALSDLSSHVYRVAISVCTCGRPMTSAHSVGISTAYVLLLLATTTTITLDQPGNIVARATLIDHIPRPAHESMSDPTQ